MSIEAPTAGGSNLVARVKGILFQPTAEWNVIDAERADIKSLFTGYAAVLAAIGPVATLIGGQLFPISVFGVTAKTPIVGAVIGAAVAYVMALVGAYVLGLIIEAAAPHFGGVKDRTKAMQVAVYFSTASWLAGIFGIFPALAMLSIVGLYSLFLLFKGLPILMKAPQDKAVGYTVVVILAAIVVWIVIGAVVTAVTGAFAVGAMGAAGLAGAGL